MPGLARLLFTLGAALIGAGIFVVVLRQFHLPFGRLPGDLSWGGRGWSVYVPLATSLLLSIILSLVLWTIGRFR